MDKVKKIKIIKLSIFIALCVLLAYVTYSVIGCITIWFTQPRFVNANGLVTSSLGFFIQFVIFAIVFIVICAATIICGIKFFKKTKQK